MKVIFVVVIGFLMVYLCIFDVCYFCCVRCFFVDMFFVDDVVVWWMFFFVIFVLFVNLFIDVWREFFSWFVIGWFGLVMLFVLLCLIVCDLVEVCVVIIFFLIFWVYIDSCNWYIKLLFYCFIWFIFIFLLLSEVFICKFYILLCFMFVIFFWFWWCVV